MDAWKIHIERCDPGATVSEDSFNLVDPIVDTAVIELSQKVNICGVVRTTPAHLSYVLVLMACLNKGYSTGLGTVETAISALTP